MIKTKIIEQPTTRLVTIECPSCKSLIDRVVKLDQHQGETECALCHTKFQWEETRAREERK